MDDPPREHEEVVNDFEDPVDDPKVKRGGNVPFTHDDPTPDPHPGRDPDVKEYPPSKKQPKEKDPFPTAPPREEKPGPEKTPIGKGPTKKKPKKDDPKDPSKEPKDHKGPKDTGHMPK